LGEPGVPVKPLCGYIATSIHDPHARILCGRTAVLDGRCAKHHPTQLEADRKERKQSAKVEKACGEYMAACTEIGAAIMDGDYYIPALAELVKKARKAKAKVRKAQKAV
jgi:hypothetical protein